MIYGNQKRRTMARSVLPSTAASSARSNLRAIARTHRRHSKAALRSLRGPVVPEDVFDEDLDDAEWSLANAASRRRSELWEAINDRRAADKIAPLERWAPKAVAHLAPQDRLPTLRSWLPDGVIGWHAMSHISFLDELSPSHEHLARYRFRPSFAHPSTEELCDRLALVIASSSHKEFNRALKTSFPGTRLLLGSHDIEDFVLWHTRDPYPFSYYGTWRRIEEVIDKVLS